MPRLKTGEVISWKEAMIRFKKGVDNITPYQKLCNEMRGTFITLLGFLFSLIAVIWKRNDIGLLAYGLILIFLGSIITTGLKYLSLRQQKKFFKDLDTNAINIDTYFNNSDDIKSTKEETCLKN